MAADIPFRNALNRCGFNATTRLYFTAILLDTATLRDYTGEDYEAMTSGIKYFTLADNWNVHNVNNGPLIIAPHALRNLKGLQRYILFCDLRNEAPNVNNFENDILTAWSLRQAELYRESKDKETPKMPAVLGKMRKWKDFDRQFVMYLAQVRGEATTYLSYLIRDHEMPTQEMLDKTYTGDNPDYASIDEALHDTIRFTHAIAKKDNRKLYFILQQLFVGGEAEVFIKRYKNTQDGRKAYIAARDAGTGDAAKTTDVAQANAIIQSYKFSGEKRNYTFENHYSKFLNAFQDLEERNNPVAPETQVQQFLASITDKRLSGGKDVIMSSERYKTDLSECANYLKSLLVGKMSKEQHSDSRRTVAETRGQGFRGKITARNYTKEEYAQFTQDQKEQLRKLRRAKKGQEKRKASQVKTGEEQDMEDDSASVKSTAEAPSDQFGRSGDKKSKKSRK